MAAWTTLTIICDGGKSPTRLWYSCVSYLWQQVYTSRELLNPHNRLGGLTHVMATESKESLLDNCFHDEKDNMTGCRRLQPTHSIRPYNATYLDIFTVLN